MDKKISIIAAGNGGQAYAAYCSSLGYDVCLYNRTLENIQPIFETKAISLTGKLNINAKLDKITNDLREACDYSDKIMIVTPATAHRQLAIQMAPYLKKNHKVLLNPGRTLGSLEFKSVLKNYTEENPIIGEAQTLVFACRIISPGLVNIIGIKQHVPITSPDKTNIPILLNEFGSIFKCFENGPSVLEVGFDNIGSIFHPTVVLFNAATIERKDSFYFYRDMTPQVADFIEQLDEERIKIGEAYGLTIQPVKDWICFAYPGTKGDTLCERMRNNPAYHDIKAPGTIFTRQITEDIPTGILPMRELAKIVNVKTPIMDGIISIISSLLKTDFNLNGRTLSNLGLEKMDKEKILKLLN